MTIESSTTIQLPPGQRVYFAGKLAGMSRREAQQLVRRHGGAVVDTLDASVQCVVVGEGALPLDDTPESELLMAQPAAPEHGAPEIVAEREFWARLGLVDEQQHVHRLYTPAMLAELLAVPLAVVRRWHRRGLIRPAREVRKLPYFDFQEVTTARRLAELLAAGVSPQAIERKLAALRRVLPNVDRPLAQLPVLVEGKELLLRQGDGLLEPGGQRRFDFSADLASETQTADVATSREDHPNVFKLRLSSSDLPVVAPSQLLDWAAELEDTGQLREAAEMYRAAMAAERTKAETCFRLAEVLYRLDDLPAARERYYMAVELDEDYVEARANLGCVLAELGERELAVAAFQGALVYHPDYPDVHYQLARTLDELGQPEEALFHWRTFAELAPDSPWSEEARARIGL